MSTNSVILDCVTKWPGMTARQIEKKTLLPIADVRRGLRRLNIQKRITVENKPDKLRWTGVNIYWARNA